MLEYSRLKRLKKNREDKIRNYIKDNRKGDRDIIKEKNPSCLPRYWVSMATAVLRGSNSTAEGKKEGRDIIIT